MRPYEQSLFCEAIQNKKIKYILKKIFKRKIWKTTPK